MLLHLVAVVVVMQGLRGQGIPLGTVPVEMEVVEAAAVKIRPREVAQPMVKVLVAGHQAMTLAVAVAVCLLQVAMPQLAQ